MNGLHTRRWARASRLLPPLLLLLLIITSPVAASDTGAFSGSVTDVLGNIIEDVEVLAVTMSSGSAPAAAARSDRSGAFRFDHLAPGVYRIVALKRGYLTFVGSVNTQAQSWFEVTEVLTLRCPRSSWTVRMSEPSSSRCVAKA